MDEDLICATELAKLAELAKHALQLVERACREAGVDSLEFRDGEVYVWNVARMAQRAPTLEEAFAQFVASGYGEPPEADK